MRHRLNALLLLLGLAQSLCAEVELSGVFFLNGSGRFSLVESASGTTSRWLRIGDTFQGYTLQSYDQEQEVLRLTAPDAELHLSLRPAVLAEAAPEADDSEIVGIGASVGPHPKGAQILRVLPDHPAERAGIAAGEVILRVNGAPLEGRDLQESVDLIRGKPQTAIHLDLWTPDSQITRQVLVIREKLNLPEAPDAPE